MQPADQKGCKMIKAAFVKDTFPYFITTLNVFDNVVHIYPLVEDLISKMILKFNNFVAYLQISGLKAKLVRFFKGKKMGFNVPFDVKHRRIRKKFSNHI